MTHPLERCDAATRRALFIVALAATVVVGAALVASGAPLNGPASPRGIVDLEFATTASAAQAILDAWGDAGVRAAAFGVGLDFLFLVAYGNAIALGAIAASPSTWTRAGRLVAWGAWLAAALDAVENVALWRTLQGDPSTQIVAPLCAAPKFALVVVGVVYYVAARVARRRRA